MKTTRVIPPFVLLLMFYGAALAGQPRKVAFRTLCVNPIPGMTELSLSNRSGGEGSVPVYVSALSPEIEGKFEGDEAVFYWTPPDGTPVVAARGPLAKSGRQLLLLVPQVDGEEADQYKILAFDDQIEAFKLGSIRAINLAPQPVRFTVGGELLAEILPSEHAQFVPAGEVNEYGMYAASAEYKGEDGEWARIYSAGWKSSDRRRQIVITFLEGEPNQPGVRVITDVPPWVAEPEGNRE